MTILRLNYAIEPRYGVLRDIADRVRAGEPVDLSLLHFGIEAGYEAWVMPRILSLFLFGGVGTTIYHSQDLQLDDALATEAVNDPTLALSLGGGLSLGQGLLVLFF